MSEPQQESQWNNEGMVSGEDSEQPAEKKNVIAMATVMTRKISCALTCVMPYG